MKYWLSLAGNPSNQSKNLQPSAAGPFLRRCLLLMKNIIVFFSLLLFAEFSSADSWGFPKEILRDEFLFGEVKLARVRDSTQNQAFPHYEIQIYRGASLEATIKGVSFEFVFADPKNHFFVGLSNSGLPGTALVFFNASGKILRLIEHRNFRPKYCRKSVTLLREWVHPEDPDLRFHKMKFEGYPHDVTVISFLACNGQRVTMRNAILEGMRSWIKETDEFKQENQDLYQVPSDFE